ncbi:hypothetical protein K491DRAFT_710067 [Lophiostoma macrostomum CBS 122681]|uniref:Uncharacterized protein n=1 Tax=Lophiostoma macrostomum CBS 122681 TaxID=1314788 RepID=A0A6A6TT71_9PLEO|nr:hypothetical protein K491DRAFT_710067 [Lophiostoma macrostomum CBS 122681]
MPQVQLGGLKGEVIHSEFRRNETLILTYHPDAMKDMTGKETKNMKWDARVTLLFDLRERWKCVVKSWICIHKCAEALKKHHIYKAMNDFHPLYQERPGEYADEYEKEKNGEVDKEFGRIKSWVGNDNFVEELYKTANSKCKEVFRLLKAEEKMKPWKRLSNSRDLRIPHELELPQRENWEQYMKRVWEGKIMGPLIFGSHAVDFLTYLVSKALPMAAETPNYECDCIDTKAEIRILVLQPANNFSDPLETRLIKHKMVHLVPLPV